MRSWWALQTVFAFNEASIWYLHGVSLTRLRTEMREMSLVAAFGPIADQSSRWTSGDLDTPVFRDNAVAALTGD
jgi:hypothetical protein